MASGLLGSESESFDTHARRDSMANARTVDIKLKFDPTDMTPGAKGRKFRRDVLLHGGRTDARGFI